MSQVEHNAAVFGIIVSIFMKADFISARQLYVYTEVIQTYGVITRSRFFGIFIEKSDRFDRIASGERQ